MGGAQVWGRKVELRRPAAARTVVVVSADAGLRQRLAEGLKKMRWTVREATGGASALVTVEAECAEAMIVDGWLPDLEVGGFIAEMEELWPEMELLRVDGSVAGSRGSTAVRSSRRHELLHVLREAQEMEPAAERTTGTAPAPLLSAANRAVVSAPVRSPAPPAGFAEAAVAKLALSAERMKPGSDSLPEMIGESGAMRELTRLIRLVAPRTATVLIEGETGTGKEVVAKAVHRLSQRSQKPFVVLNCAAIPESLLEAELFGHTRGAFTGAVQSRMGRIEAAHGGTLFLDEIGEMPLALQAKMLRFLECGELQKVGENETIRVDVRVIAATHQQLEAGAGAGTFRLDLYHRLAVFPVEVPALRERMDDLPLLVEFFLEQIGRTSPRKGISAGAMARLQEYRWPGNVRELMHVLERASILAEERAEIQADEIRTGGRRRA